VTAPAKLAMRAFKLLAKAGAAAIIWTLLNWEDVTPNWEDITDLWEG
jgi:hypothetical protein